PQLLLGPAQLGRVARDACEADQLTCVVAQCRGHDVGPVLRAVLAYAPALDLGPSALRRLAQLALRLRRTDVLGQVEQGEMQSDDLVGRVAGDPARARIPGQHVAVGVE